MKCIDSIVALGAVLLLAGCASTRTVAVVEPVGPAPASSTKPMAQGSLQVYSAREKEPVAVGDMEWEWDYNLANSPFTYGLAHTDYAILTQAGESFRYVRNAHNSADPTPAVVTLLPGRYEIKAQAEGHSGELANVIIPVAVEPGKLTVVHLSGNWKPDQQFSNDDVVRLPDGQIAGWLARR